jgi:hypothetical protein
MANNVQDTKNEALSMLAVIHSINSDPALANNDAVKDAFIKDLPSQPGQFGKKLSDLKSKLKKKKESVSNVFTDLTLMCETFLGTSQKYQASKYKLPVKNRLKQIIEESCEVTMRAAMQILLETAQETLFAGDGVCGSDTPIPSNTLILGPGDFDFLNMLTIDPLTKMGQVLYEDINAVGQQLNRSLHDLFSNHTPYDFTFGQNQKLFTIYWDENSQNYGFSGLTQNSMTVGKMLKNFYSNIHIPTKLDVLRMAMLLTTLGDKDNSHSFDISVNDLNKLLQKIFANCGNPNNNGLNQNPENQFNENDEDIEFYFDFNNVEGIDLDDESRRFRKVMKFVDCGNFEYEIPIQHLEDFVYLPGDDLSGKVNDILENIANDAHNASNSNLSPEDFHLSLLNNFNLNVPYSMIACILSPKNLLPIIMIYKLFNLGADKIKDIMRKLSKLFFKVIRKIYWKFIHEFWIRVKKDLLDFLKITALNILKEKYARYYAIVASLIAILKKVLDKNLDNCQVLYKLVVQTIDTALSAASFSLNIPGLLLSLADFRSGYSSTRAIMNITKLANNKGVNTSPLHGVTNKLNHVFSSMVKGHDQENSMNSKVMSGNKLAIIPIAGLSGPLIIPPGAITSAGLKL